MSEQDLDEHRCAECGEPGGNSCDGCGVDLCDGCAEAGEGLCTACDWPDDARDSQ